MCSQNKCIRTVFLTLFPSSNKSGQEKKRTDQNKETMRQIEAKTIKIFMDFADIKFIPLNSKTLTSFSLFKEPISNNSSSAEFRAFNFLSTETDFLDNTRSENRERGT